MHIHILLYEQRNKETNDNDRGVENEEIYIIILHCVTYSSLDDLK